MSEKTVKLSITKAASIMGCSSATVYNRIKKRGWHNEKDFDNKAWVWIPVEYLSTLTDSTHEAIEKLAQEDTQDEAKPEHTNNNGLDTQLLDRITTILEKNYEERLKTNELLVQSQAELLKAKETQIKSLNNELASANNAIMRIKKTIRKKHLSLGGNSGK